MKKLMDVNVQYRISLVLWIANVVFYAASFILPVMYDLINGIFMIFAVSVIIRFAIAGVREQRKNGDYGGRASLDLYWLDGKLRLILILSFVVTILNFLIHFFVFLRDGGAKIVDGAYWVVNHGELIRQITEAEYLRLCMAEARMFIGQFLVFNALCLAYFGQKRLSVSDTK